MHLDYTKVIILILWWRNFQLEYWRTFQLVSTYINGKPTVNYIRELQNGSTKEEQKTLTEKIRHQIHHPENCHNAPYTEADIRQSIEDMRTFIMNKRES